MTARTDERVSRWLLPAMTLRFLAACGRTPSPAPRPDVPAVPRDAVTAAAPAVVVDAGPPDVIGIGLSPRVTVSACGDLALTPTVIAEAAHHDGDGRLGWMLAPLAPLLGGRAIAFVDLRGALSSHPGTASRDRFVGALDIARAMSRTGFDVVQLANDHALDDGAAVLGETLQAFAPLRAVTTGACVTARPCAPTVVERDGVRTAFLAATTRSSRAGSDHPGAADLGRVEGDGSGLVEQVRAARAGVDVLVLGLHVGRDGLPPAGSSRRALVDRLLEAGADLVLVTGPERVGPVERRTTPRGDAAVAWSLGSVLSGLGAGWHPGVSAAAVAANPWVYDPSLRDGVVLHATFDTSTAGHVTLTGLTANALWMSRADDVLRVVPLRTMEPVHRDERLTALRSALGPAVRLRP